MEEGKFQYDNEHAKERHYTRNKPKSRLFIILVIILIILLVLLLAVVCLYISGVIGIDSNNKTMSKTTVTEENFGTSSNGEEVKRYKLKNSKCNIEVEFITFGGTLTSIKVPDKTGKLVDVNLGFDTLQGYEGPGNPYFGALVGRYANRIGNGHFTYNGVDYQLTINNNENHLHGGTVGWSNAVWKATIDGNSVILSHFSKDGDQGYPGSVTANVTFDVTNEGELRMKYKATASGKTTPINLTTHPYFNLGGEGSGTVYDHLVTLYADKYTPVNDKLIPTGEIANVESTLFDLRSPTILGTVVNNVTGGGFDHNFCINGPTGKRRAARVSNPETGIVMEVYTNQPGVQFYTGNFLNVQTGKNGHTYSKHSAFCLETQNYPDSPNQANFPDPFLSPGSEYQHTVWYKFSTE